MKPGKNESVSNVHVGYALNIYKKGILHDEASSTLTREASLTKKDVLEKITGYMIDTLKE